jgi:hypothetical protein
MNKIARGSVGLLATSLALTCGLFAVRVDAGIGGTDLRVQTKGIGGSDLVAYGVIEGVAGGGITVLGQHILIQPSTALSVSSSHVAIQNASTLLGQIGTLVAVYGQANSDGSIRASEIDLQPTPYVPGATTVYLRGVVSDSNSAIAKVRVGTLLVDYSAALHQPLDAPLHAGAVVEFTGIQVSTGSVYASNLRTIQGIGGTDAASLGIGGTDNAVKALGIGGTDVATLGIGGTDKAVSALGIGGTDIAIKAKGIGGTDTATLGIGGTDKAVRALGIGGTDLAIKAKGIGGTDAVTLGIGGTDKAVRALGIGGTDLAIKAKGIGGTDAATLGIGGTDKAVRALGIGGTDLAVKGIGGTDAATLGIGGTD